MAYELVLLVPVLVLLTLFVLWAGRGGRAELSADLAAEEAATAASLCCEEGAAGEPDRDELAEDIVASRPWLEFLCVGGLRPQADNDSGNPGDDPEFVTEHWVEFEAAPGVRTGGVGILGVQFECETDGAVAPLRGLFPTVTFQAQASEVIHRRPPPLNVGFSSSAFRALEAAGDPPVEGRLVFTLSSFQPMPQDVVVQYLIDVDGTTATANADYTPPPAQAPPPVPGPVNPLGLLLEVVFPAGATDVQIEVDLVDDGFYEGDETIALELHALTRPNEDRDPLPAGVAQLDDERVEATGVIEDDDPRPHVFLHNQAPPCQATEGDLTGEAIGGVEHGFTVRLRDEDNQEDAPSAAEVTVILQTQDIPGGAVAGTDYTAVPGVPLTFAPGVTELPPPPDGQPIRVETIDEHPPEAEADESFTVRIANPNGALPGSITEAECTIIDDEAILRVVNSEADRSVEEGDSGAPGEMLDFVIALDRAIVGPVEAAYELVAYRDGLVNAADRGTGASCADGGDYLPQSGTLEFQPNGDQPPAQETVSVVVCGDDVPEPDETLWLSLEVTSGEAVAADGGALGTIVDNDTLEIAASDARAVEGELLEFQVELQVRGSPATLASAVEVEYNIAETTPPSAQQGSDFDADAGPPETPLTGRLRFGPGLTDAQTLPVQLLADHELEDDETFEAVFSDAGTNGEISFETRTATGTIEEDPPPVLSVDSWSGEEGDTRAFTITLSDPRDDETVTVAYTIAGSGANAATAPGHPTNPADFEAAPSAAADPPHHLTGTLTFAPPPGSLPGTAPATSQTVTIDLLDDTIADEPDETLRLTLSNPDKAVLSDTDPFGTGTITNRNPPVISVDNPTAAEGEPMIFTVTLDRGRLNEEVEVNFQVLSRSAKSDRDFPLSPDFEAVDPGQLTLVRVDPNVDPTTTVVVQTLADKIAENPETLQLVLSGAQPDHVAIDPAIGTGTIEDVVPATVRVNSPTAVEGEPLRFEIALVDQQGLPAPTTQNVTVTYRTSDRTATGSDADCDSPGADYLALSSTTVEFPASDSPDPYDDRVRRVEVATCRDAIDDEGDETMALLLEVPPDNHAASLGDAEGTGTISDYPPPRIRIDNPVPVREGEQVEFTVSLHDEFGRLIDANVEVTVQWATVDRTAIAGLDYTPDSGTVTFMPGDAQQPILVTTLADDIWESDETFRVDLSRPTNALLEWAVGVGTIQADCVDLLNGTEVSVLTVEDQALPESAARFYVGPHFSRPLCDSFDLERTIVAGTATAGGQPWDEFHLSVPAPFTQTYGAITSTLQVLDAAVAVFNVGDDFVDEPDEVFYVEWRWGPDMPARFRRQPAARGAFTIIDDDPPARLRVAEASAPAGQTLTFWVTLEPASGHTVTAVVATSDNSATAPDDYSAATETLEFLPGETRKSFSVATSLNTAGEGDETFWAEITGAVNADIDDALAQGTILAGSGSSLAIFDAAADEGDTMELRVELSQPLAQPVTVDYATVERSGENAAAEGVDYYRTTDTLTFAPGETEAFAAVEIIDDGENEVAETFLVQLSNQTSGVSLADSSAVGTINGSIACFDLSGRGTGPAEPLPVVVRPSNLPGDDFPTASVTGLSAVESDGRMDFTITVSEPLCRSYIFDYQVWSSNPAWRMGTTAVLNEDYRYPEEVSLAAGETQVDWYLELIDDDLVEGTETFRFDLRSVILPGLYSLENVVYIAEILDDDVATLQLPEAGETTADEGGFLSFTVRVDKHTFEDVTFDYEVAAGPAPSATAVADFAPASGTATIPAGEFSTTVWVRTAEDQLYEHDENVSLTVSNITGAQPDPDGDTATGTILDDDDLPIARVSDPAADEGDELVFEVRLDAPSGRDATVWAFTRDGTATSDSDYEAVTPHQLTIPAGQQLHTVAVQTLSDDTVEATELMFLQIYAPQFLSLGDDTGAGSITDATQRSVSVSDAWVIEGGTLRFTVGFATQRPSQSDIVLEYRTAAGTAEAGDDYDDAFETAPGQLRIPAGATSATVEVATVADRLDEDTERLRLVLSNPQGAMIADGEAAGVIIDDDPLPALSVGNAEATENGDGTPITFTVALSEESGRDVAVRYSTQGVTAQPGDDFTAANRELLTIPAGDQSASVTVDLVNDDVAEDIEVFQLVLSDPDNATLDDSVGAGRIIDDDGLIQILIDDAAEVYEAAGASAVFPVRLSRADPANQVTVDYATENASAQAGSDFTAAARTLTFAAGATSTTVAVPLINDDIVEQTEAFRLVLDNPSSNAELGTQRASATILDDDALPEISAADASAVEGTTAVFAVRLSKQSAREATVDYSTAADPFAGDTAATPAQDFEVVSGTLTVPARATSATVPVPLPDDALNEHTETFWLRLTGPTGATILDGTATGSIDDNDPLPALSIADASAIEGRTLRFEVRLSTPSGRTVVVPWTTVARSPATDSAQPWNPLILSGDYISASGALEFTPGSTLAHIDVATIEDSISEQDERFFVHLGDPAGATIGDSAAVGIIDDNDGRPRVSIADTTVSENAGPAVFTVTVEPTSSQFLSIGYATSDDSPADGAATAGEDYAATADGTSDTLVIAPGAATGEISVFIADDDLVEGTETFAVTISGNSADVDVTEGGRTATGFILDDDTATISIADAEACEDGSTLADCQVRTCRTQTAGLTFEQFLVCESVIAAPGACPEGMCAGNGVMEFPVTLTGEPADEVTVRYTTFDVTANQSRDYISATGTVTFPAGTTSALIPVSLVDDAIDELAIKTLRVVLHDPVGAQIGTAEAIGTIHDDDPLPRASAERFGTYSNENDGFAYHWVTLTQPSELPISVPYYIGSVSYRPGVVDGIDDSPGTLTFPPGEVGQILRVPLNDDNYGPYGAVDSRPFTATYTVNLDTWSGENVAPHITVGDGYVWDDETPPYVASVGASDVLEGAGEAAFAITLNRIPDIPVTATYRTVDGTATAGTDYTAVEDTVTFPAGATTATVTVAITDDSDAEEDEEFTLEIFDDPRNSNLTYVARPHADGHASRRGSVVIKDDDSPVEISVDDAAANENAGTMQFWVALSRSSTAEIAVNYETSDGTATAGEDYTSTSTTLRIPAGAMGAFVPVEIIDDDDDTEDDETFLLTLSNAAGADIADTEATGTIIEDANLPTVTIPDASRGESAASGTNWLTFYVSGEERTEVFTVDWRVETVPSLGDEAATIGPDFLAPRLTGTATLYPGSYPITNFRIVDDRIPERDERFRLVLSNPRGALLGNSRAWGTIEDDDLPVVTVADVEASEADDNLVFTVQLHAPGVEPASLDYTTAVRSSQGDAAARPGEDYRQTSSTLQIPAGETTATISVPIIGDSIDEFDESFLLVLSNPVNLEFRDQIAVGTIEDDDDGFTIDDPSVYEDDGSMVFTVQRDHTSTSAVTVGYTATAASAAAGTCGTDDADFETPAGSVTLQPADTQAQISVTICDDTATEGDETLAIELNGVPGRKLTGIGTIIDDDGSTCIDTTFPPDAENPPSLVIDAPTSITEGETATVTITVEPRAFCGSKSLTFTTSPGRDIPDATQPQLSFAEIASGHTQGGISFSAGSTTSATFRYSFVDDNDPEPTEYFDFRIAFCGFAWNPCALNVSSRRSFHPDWATLPAYTATIAIEDNDTLTATFENVPPSHDGTEFSFEVHFSEEVDISYLDFTGELFEVTGVEILSASRQVQNSDLSWDVTARPLGTQDIAISVPGGRECTADGAVCTPHGGQLSSTTTANILYVAPP